MVKSSGKKVHTEQKPVVSIIRTRAQKLREANELLRKVLHNIDYYYQLNGHEPTEAEQPLLAAYIRKLRNAKKNGNLHLSFIDATEKRLPWFVWSDTATELVSASEVKQDMADHPVEQTQYIKYMPLIFCAVYILLSISSPMLNWMNVQFKPEHIDMRG